MLLCVIDTMEVREVATANITGAFLHTGYDKAVLLIVSHNT